MKTTKLIALFAAAGLVFAACEKPETEDQTIAVESVSLDETISEGHELTEGATLDISDYVTVLPENATDKTVSYSSSKTDIATVSEAGVITAVAEGETEITVKAGDKTVKFILTVTVNITAINVTENSKTYTSEDRKVYDLSEYFTVEPAENTDAVTFASSDEDVAKIENGKMSIGVAGEATITIAAQSNPDIKATITVTVNQYVGDYPRFEGDEKDEQAAIEGENWYWTMTCSIDPLKSYNGRNNSLTAMLDGRSIVTRAGTTNKDDAALTNGTAFCFDQMKSVWDESDATTFTIDMGKIQAVNYFRIQNISKDRDDVQVRFCKFNKIEGSNDGTQFTTIATDLSWENAIALGTTNDQGRPEYNFETDNIKFNETVSYRYLRFSCWDPDCFERKIVGGTQGGSGQIAEFYLGYDAE